MNNYFQDVWAAVLIVLSIIMACLMGGLLWEYRYFCSQAQELQVIKQHYYFCVDELQKKIGHEKKLDFVDGEQREMQDVDIEGLIVIDEDSSDESDDDIARDEEYVRAGEHAPVINRQPGYLKESMIDYLKAEELDSLITAIDMDQWVDYTEQTAVIPKQKGTLQKVVKQVTGKQKISSGRQIKKEIGLVWPINKGMFWLSSLFGPRKRINGTWGFHHGIDMAAAKGTAVKAARQGAVVEAGFQKGYGNTVLIVHDDGFLKTRYAHLHAIRVRKGQIVKQGELIGTVGDTGFVRRTSKDGSHLHFEVYERDLRINPLHCLTRIT